MIGVKFLLNRRVLLTLLGGSTTTLFPAIGLADEPDGFNPLQSVSIPVKSPTSVVLIAIASAGIRLVAVGEHGVIIYSDDNGITWTQGLVPVNVTLTTVGFATSMIGWAAGFSGAVLATVDGGKSWLLQLGGDQANKLTMIAADDPSIATNPSPGAPLALRRAQHFEDEGPDKPFLCMIVFSPQNLLVFGAYRMAVRSTDGGKTWADWSLNIYDKYSHNLYGAAIIGGNAYLVGELGLVFRSTNAGQTFLPLSPTSSSTLFGILGARDGSLIVYGVAGACYRSADGGKTWINLTLATQDDITAGRVLESGAVVLATEAGALFKSTDEGLTFSAVPGIETLPFFDIEQAQNGDFIIIGAAGVYRVSKQMLNT